ncbi:Pr6Pr family membrane protein [Tindallia californiensis]|uniref:Pr6Pr family membrane protein n=1 Tax=Tindallia californiensis TaxID=159292 RepID=UPI001A9A410B|nr:Pr6Pr family membrane protein [Tindallia californiensis]
MLLSYLFMMNGVHHQYGPVKAFVHVFRLFTNQSNLLVVLWAFLELKRTNQKKELEFSYMPGTFRGGLVVYIFMTFLVYHLFLRNTYTVTGPSVIINGVTHYIIPAAYILDWYLTEKRQIYRFTHIFFWMLYPLGYLVIGISYGKITGSFPYEYLNWHLEGLSYIIGYGTIIIMCFIAVSILCVCINRQTLFKRKNVKSRNLISPQKEGKQRGN